jgi:amidase
MNDEACFLMRFDGDAAGRPVAIKDLIDMAGTPTTGGCRALAEIASPADHDAACLAGIRAEESAGRLHIIGKTNMHELGFGITGINRWSGTPANPLDESLVPGGSSSGSAVVVALGLADMALGTDTGGSIRIPAACCGISGLKTTFGRISVDGLWPLAPSLDTVGPLARTVEGLVWGMQLLEPGFDLTGVEAVSSAGRLRFPANPAIDEAIDRNLTAAGIRSVPVDLPGWEQTAHDTMGVIASEAFESDGHLLASGKVGDDVAGRLRGGAEIDDRERRRLVAAGAAWKLRLGAELSRVGLLVTPTLSDFPPRLDEAEKMYTIRQTHPVNLAGIPALALPVPTGGPLPASLQLIGPAGSEELLLATGVRLEAAAG